jgi:hypothetical protein
MGCRQTLNPLSLPTIDSAEGVAAAKNLARLPQSGSMAKTSLNCYMKATFWFDATSARSHCVSTSADRLSLHFLNKQAAWGDSQPSYARWRLGQQTNVSSRDKYRQERYRRLSEYILELRLSGELLVVTQMTVCKTAISTHHRAPNAAHVDVFCIDFLVSPSFQGRSCRQVPSLPRRRYQ